MGERRVAMITGASRGIGRATALAMAGAGYDIVVTARSTTSESVAFVAGTTSNDPDQGAVLAGGLPSLLVEIDRLGARAAAVAMDLTDRASVHEAATAAMRSFGRVDVLVNNAIYQGPGINDTTLTTTVDLVDQVVAADAITPLILVQAVVPGMIERGDGAIIHLTSGAATLAPRAPFGQGGWGLAYAIAKGGAHRMVGVLHAELAGTGIRAYNLNPGHVLTEVGKARAARAGAEPTGQSAQIPALAAVWLADNNAETRALSGTDVVALELVNRLELNT